MTEAQWLTSTDPQAMLSALTAKYVDVEREVHVEPTARKLRLLACACYRSATQSGSIGLEAAAIAEAWAESGDPPTTPPNVRNDWAINFADPGEHARAAIQWSIGSWGAAPGLLAALARDIFGNPFRPVVIFYGPMTYCPEGSVEIYGHQWKSWLSWHDSLIPKLAEAAYQERRDDDTLNPERLAVLADALEEAGCADTKCDACGGTGTQDKRKGPLAGVYARWPCDRCNGERYLSNPLLAHLRSPSPHVRGCRAIDLLTGRS